MVYALFGFYCQFIAKVFTPFGNNGTAWLLGFLVLLTKVPPSGNKKGSLSLNDFFYGVHSEYSESFLLPRC